MSGLLVTASPARAVPGSVSVGPTKNSDRSGGSRDRVACEPLPHGPQICHARMVYVSIRMANRVARWIVLSVDLALDLAAGILDRVSGGMAGVLDRVSDVVGGLVDLVAGRPRCVLDLVRGGGAAVGGVISDPVDGVLRFVRRRVDLVLDLVVHAHGLSLRSSRLQGSGRVQAAGSDGRLLAQALGGAREPPAAAA